VTASDNSGRISEVFDHPYRGEDVAESNAKLIVKAPEMKEVIKGLLRAYAPLAGAVAEHEGESVLHIDVQRARAILKELGELGDLA